MTRVAPVCFQSCLNPGVQLTVYSRYPSSCNTTYSVRPLTILPFANAETHIQLLSIYFGDVGFSSGPQLPRITFAPRLWWRSNHWVRKFCLWEPARRSNNVGFHRGYRRSTVVLNLIRSKGIDHIIVTKCAGYFFENTPDSDASAICDNCNSPVTKHWMTPIVIGKSAESLQSQRHVSEWSINLWRILTPGCFTNNG